MGIIRFFAVLVITSVMLSCSSDGDGQNSVIYKENGVEIPVPVVHAYKQDKVYYFLAQNEDGRSIEIWFNSSGQLMQAKSTPGGDPFSFMASAYDYSLNSFDFELVSLNESAKTFKLNYSGKLFDDEYDVANSSFVNVSGSAQLHYEDVTWATGLEVTAKIDGSSWRSAKQNRSYFGEIENVVLEETSDDPFRMTFYIHQAETQPGIYTFNATSEANRIVLSKYSIATHSYVEYNSSGTFTITSTTANEFGETRIEGTYSFTATNPSDGTTLQVTDGVFKEMFST
jgi:hypothetical protein